TSQCTSCMVCRPWQRDQLRERTNRPRSATIAQFSAWRNVDKAQCAQYADAISCPTCICLQLKEVIIMMEEKMVPVRNGMFETKLRTDGSGAPLLFLHGAGGLRGWDPFLVELAQHFTVYAPAHPGFETSTGLDHIDDIIDMVVYYNDLLD